METKKTGRGRRLIFALLLLVLVYVFVEAASFLVFRLKYDTPLPLRNPETGLLSEDIGVLPSAPVDRDGALDEDPIQGANEKPRAARNGEVLHPFLGFVRDPDVSGRVSEYGFMLKNNASSIHQRSDEKLLVGIFGGSVAAGFSGRGSAPFVRALKKFPEFEEKEIVIIPYAMGGYKQPQQLMALNYLLLLGGELDIAINLDGYNEIALHHGPNKKQGVFPMYPTAWNWRVSNLEDEELRGMAGGILYLRDWQNGLRSSLGESIWRHSPTVNLVWKTIDNRLTDAMNEKQEAINFYEPETQTYAATGPRVEFGDEETVDHLVDIWSRSSQQMAHISRANDIRYFHFLQPNQYVEDSKPMSSEEKAIAIRDTARSRVAARDYGRLIAEGKQLKNDGVPFYDLTAIFEEVEEPAYMDSCCHLNQRGNRIKAEVMAKAIAESWNDPQ